MDFLSESTKKERRNLLATGFAGIIVAQLKIYPTDVELVGLKFHSPELPLIAVGGLCAAIIYFLVKFYTSFLYEQSSALRNALATQIREGKTAMDIALEEESLNNQERHLMQQIQILQRQQEHEEKRIKILQDKIDQDAIAHEVALKITDQKRRDLDQALAQHVPTPDEVSIFKSRIEKEIKLLEESRESYLRQREIKHQQDVENLENEKNNRKEMHEVQDRKLDSDEIDVAEKRKSILRWKQVHTVIGRVSPLHLFLEIHLPLLIGVIAIYGLGSLMLHFPPPPIPSPLPDI